MPLIVIRVAIKDSKIHSQQYNKATFPLSKKNLYTKSKDTTHNRNLWTYIPTVKSGSYVNFCTNLKALQHNHDNSAVFTFVWLIL